LSARRFERYIALGDSSTEGIADGDPRTGYLGWSRRLAERITASQGGLLYANLAQRGLTTREIRDRQLPRALAMSPDLATVFSGTNDVLAPRFDVAEFAGHSRALLGELRDQGATVLTFTLPDLTPLMPAARLFAPRIVAMNVELRAVCAATGATLVDFAAHAVATDARLWNEDRIHANPAGHARIADALAEALGLPDASPAWREPLPATPTPGVLAVAAREAAWVARHLLPWSVAGLLGAGRRPKTHPGPQPELQPVLLSRD
jgi:lysophospholipase L1-like esterase